jgi:hypothetical protein
MRHLAFAACAVTLCALIAGAQPGSRKEPAQYVATERASRVEARPPGIRLGLRKPREFALAPLSGSELARLAVPGSRLKTGVHRNLPPTALAAGAWELTAEGTRVWRMAIHSPGASAIRLEFRDFEVGNGKVWLYDGAHSAGPYTGRGSFGNGRFWSDTLFAESVILEYEPDAAAAPLSEPPFQVRTISHSVPRARRAAWDSPLGPQTAKDPAAYCHLDPNCYPEWKGAMSMVGQITFEEGEDQYFCSGALVATRDNSFKPYFLTAGHCINTEDAARTIEAYWTYQTSTCGGQPPASRETSAKSSVGGHLIDVGRMGDGDYSLVLLKDVPSGVTFSGWDISDPPLTTELTGIHHPMSSWKRISFGERLRDSAEYVEGEGVAPADKFFQIVWDKGRAEPGSSGSPLFSSPGVIVGMLSYGGIAPGLSVCAMDPSVVGYGRFSNAYTHLKDYLENLPAAMVKADKSDLGFTVANRTAPAAQVVRLTTQSTSQISYKLRADASWVRLSTMTGTLSANSPAQVSISIDPAQFDRPDTYSTTVTIFSGAAAPQFVNITATMTAAPSAVNVTITPNPVVQSGGQWSFMIRLEETGGAPTRVTALKLNTTDYSSSIKGWFGTDHIDAKGAIEAPLQGKGRFPSGTQYFEFWGIDDATGQHWYRVATIAFQ